MTTPAQLLNNYGVPCVLPGTLINSPELQDNELPDVFLRVKDGLPVRPPPTPSTPPPWIPDLKLVYIHVDSVKPPLSQKYIGPYPIKRQNQNTVTVMIGNTEERVNISRCKPFLSSYPPVAPAPVRRGRPPRAAAGGSM